MPKAVSLSTGMPLSVLQAYGMHYDMCHDMPEACPYGM